VTNPWFRLYTEFAHDPKVQMLSEADQRRLVMLMCMRSGTNDETFHDTTTAFQLRISEDEWARTKVSFIAAGFIDETNKLLNWDKRQYRSDSSTQRVRKHREAKRNTKKQLCNGLVTPPDSDSDTDKKEKDTSYPKKGSRLDENWVLPADWETWAKENGCSDPKFEADQFRDFWISKTGANATKRDWLATWRTWIRRNHKPKRSRLTESGRMPEQLAKDF